MVGNCALRERLRFLKGEEENHCRLLEELYRRSFPRGGDGAAGEVPRPDGHRNEGGLTTATDKAIIRLIRMEWKGFTPRLKRLGCWVGE
ncbi:TPA: hypothetical protein EYP12_05275 [Candidatus Bipolaricaulota bacterium]|nr:hypothetical protein [Candidatus Bipolaricaulota bacterium]